jgi:hypothetical protein
MDYQTLLKYVLAIVETGALIGVLVFLTKAFKEKKDEKVRKGYYTKALPFLLVYLALNLLRNFCF